MSKDSEPIERNETYTAARLHVSDIPGAVEVRVGETAAMQVRITGPEKLVERIRREVRGDVLHISGPRGGGGGVTVVSHGRGSVQTNVFRGGRGGVHIAGGNFGIISTGRGATVVSGGDMVISGGRVISGGEDVTFVESEEVRIVVDVPLRTPITIDEAIIGQYDIGDIEGPIDLRLKGTGDVTVGRVTATRVDLSGTSRAEILAVNGRELRADVSGTGNITVREGQVERLSVHVSGVGDVTYGGVARRADLSVSGMGNIRVNQVTDSIDNDRVSGMGRISVHVRPPQDPGTFWS